MKTICILFLITMGMVGCKHLTGWKPTGDFISGNVDTTSKQFIIPRALSAKIQKDYLNYMHKTAPGLGLSDSEILSQIPRGFLNVSFYFLSDEPGVLANNTQFDLPRGGGQIDLANVVAGNKGSFYLHYKISRADVPADQKATPKNLKIYFMSETKPLHLRHEDYGVGCGRYMDVTSNLRNANDADGFHLNATNQRYVPVIGGTFYFVSFGPDKKIYLASVRVVDSRYPEQQCAALK